MSVSQTRDPRGFWLIAVNSDQSSTLWFASGGATSNCIARFDRRGQGPYGLLRPWKRREFRNAFAIETCYFFDSSPLK